MAMDVTIERYAEIRAELEAGRLRDDVLARAGLTVDEWIAAQRGWLEQLSRELKRDRFELTNRYSRVFLDHQRALTTAATRLPPPAPAVPHIPDAAIRPAALPVMMAPMHAVAPVIFEAETAPMPPRVARPAAALAGTMNVDRSVFGAALPFAPGSTAPAIATATVPSALSKVNRAPSELTGARGVDASAFGPALPFLGGAPPPSPTSTLETPPPLAPSFPVQSAPSGEAPRGAAPLLVPKVKRADPLLSGTMNADNTVFGPSLPFAPGSSIAAIATATALPKVNRAPAELTGTVGVDLSALGAALPFLGGSPPPAPPAPPAPPTPTGQSVGLDSWTVEHYASLCAEMAFNPAATSETLSRYRLTSESRSELDRRWKVRLSVDPAALGQWRAAYQTYLAFLGTRQP
jgi:hypothetical protein